MSRFGRSYSPDPPWVRFLRETLTVILLALTCATAFGEPPTLTNAPLPRTKQTSDAERFLRLTIEPLDSEKTGMHGDPESGPWFTATFKNTGKAPWFFSRDAQNAGLSIRIHDEDGSSVILTKLGVEIQTYRETSRPRRNVDLLPGKSEPFVFGLGHYAYIKPDHKYQIEILWTIQMHHSAAARWSMIEPFEIRDLLTGQ